MNNAITAGSSRSEKLAKPLLLVMSFAMLGYHLLYTQIQIGLQSGTAHLITHLGFAFVVVFLSLIMISRKQQALKWCALILSVAITVYFRVSLQELLEVRTVIKPLVSDIIVAGLVVIITVYAAYLTTGKTFTFITALSIIYLFWGRYLPRPFTVPGIMPERLVMWLGAAFGTDEGIYGEILRISGMYLFLFVVFGSFLSAFGGLRFILGFGKWVGARVRSGPAAVAVIGSSLLGSMTGSTIANITITGTFTIPLMKKGGYLPEQAAAIESVSSNGGQIMPPIMGIAAFLMAGFAGIPYIKIVVAAIGPALIFYFCVFVYVQLNAARMEIKQVLEPIKIKEILLDAPLFVIPLTVLVVLLVKAYSLPYVAFWSIASVVAVGLLNTIRKDVRLDFRQVVETITDGVRTASEIAIICALIGIVSTVIKVSGLGIKLPMIIEDVSGGIVVIALIIAMISSIILGMGVPTQVAYIFVAIGAIPALINMGIPVLQAHFFCFLAATFSHITPPIALGALVAARIARGSYWKTCAQALKASWTIYLLPFLVVYTPVVILRPDSALLPSILQVLAVLAGVVAMQVFLTDYCMLRLKTGERIFFAAAALLCFGGLFTHHYAVISGGIALCGASIVRQVRSGRRSENLRNEPVHAEAEVLPEEG